jgi:tripartite-type tricarboxylate transporter receptor subunit TctC
MTITPPNWTPEHKVSELAVWFTAASPVPRSDGSARPLLADIPTMDESGFPGFDVTVWFGLIVPAGTSAAIIKRLHRETFVDVIKVETPYWARVIKDTGIKPVE